MIRNLYFVRHGQTDWNVGKKIMGRADIELNQTGLEQAKQTGEKLSELDFLTIIASPLQRALQTAKVIAQRHPDAEFIVDDGFAERDFGKFEGRVNDGHYFGLWDYGRDQDKMSDGETTDQLFARTAEALDRIIKNYDGDVLLVAHGGIGVMVEAYFRGLPDDGDMLKYVASNGEVRKYEISERK